MTLYRFYVKFDFEIFYSGFSEEDINNTPCPYLIFYFRGHKDKIFEVRCDPNNVDKMVTVGVRHIKFWTQAGGGLTSKRGTYGTVGKAETQLCVTYPKDPGMLVTGASNGQLYIWNKQILKGCVDGHQGPVFAIHALEKVTYSSKDDK